MVMILDQAAGGGKKVIKKSADCTVNSNKKMDYLDQLEAEAIYILREVAGQFDRPALLFSGGKDSICLVHLAIKAFRPGKFPFPLVHVDTGHNFEEALKFRDELAEKLGERGAKRVNGKIVRVPLGQNNIWVNFGSKKMFWMPRAVYSSTRSRRHRGSL